MNGKDLLKGLSGLAPEFYQEAENGTINSRTQGKAHTIGGTVGRILIAAAIASALTVTASAAGSGWFRQFFERTSSAPLSSSEADFLTRHEQPIYESQTRDGYTLTVKSAISDGRIAYINIGITAPEEAVISRTEIPGYNPAAPILAPENFGPGMVTHGDGSPVSATVRLETLEDYDGRDNTQDWILKVEPDLQGEPLPFGPGNEWKLHMENLVASYQNDDYQKELNERLGGDAGALAEIPDGEMEKLMPKVVLARGNWDFTLALQACDTRTIELIGEPVTTSCIVGWKEDGTEVSADVKITSITLGSLRATLSAETDSAPSFSSISEAKYIQVVLKDGSQVRLRPSSASPGQVDLEAERPIILDNVDYLLLPDGTKLPMP